jgi:hypothetical protein
MLQQQRALLSSVADCSFILIQHAALDEAKESEDTDASLDETAQTEREYVRQRLRDELKREPSDQDVDEWLRQHTEGY